MACEDDRKRIAEGIRGLNGLVVTKVAIEHYGELRVEFEGGMSLSTFANEAEVFVHAEPWTLFLPGKRVLCADSPSSFWLGPSSG